MTTEKRKLNNDERHLLRLVLKGKEEDGWTPVSEIVWPLVCELPKELVVLQKKEEGGKIKLTPEGEFLLIWL